MKEQLEKEGQAVKDQLLRDSELRKKENDALKTEERVHFKTNDKEL